MLDKSILQEAVYKTPLVLLALRDQEDIRIVNNYLPYSTGFEVEADWIAEKGDSLDPYRSPNVSKFEKIPNILHIQCDTSEQRFRIPNGINGLICLYNICTLLKSHCSLTTSGIHYHIDCTDCYDDLVKPKFLKDNTDWILNELDSWNYQGTYNEKGISTNRLWVRTNDFKRTFEFRIGEMSFDYEVLVNRIIHANSIIKRLKNKVQSARSVQYDEFNKKEILLYLKTFKNDNHKIENLKKQLLAIKVPLKNEFTESYSEDEKRNLINKRIIKI